MYDLIQERIAFEKLYAAWLAARAAEFQTIKDIAIDDPRVDDVATNAETKTEEAARLLLATPSPVRHCFWRKFEVLELWITDDQLDGESFDRRVIFALGCIKADLARLDWSGTWTGQEAADVA